MKVIYTSPIFKDESGQPLQFKVPLAGLKYHQKRDYHLLEMMNLGGIHAQLTPEFLAHRKAMLSAKRKIEKNGFFSEVVHAQ